MYQVHLPQWVGQYPCPQRYITWKAFSSCLPLPLPLPLSFLPFPLSPSFRSLSLSLSLSLYCTCTILFLFLAPPTIATLLETCCTSAPPMHSVIFFPLSLFELYNMQLFLYFASFLACFFFPLASFLFGFFLLLPPFPLFLSSFLFYYLTMISPPVRLCSWGACVGACGQTLCCAHFSRQLGPLHWIRLEWNRSVRVLTQYLYLC